jgi:hypothetical protein
VIDVHLAYRVKVGAGDTAIVIAMPLADKLNPSA